MAAGLMLIEDDSDEIGILGQRYEASRNNSSHLALTVVTSLGCNFKCPYCFEDKHPSVMDEEVQELVFELLENQMSRISSFHVTWFGGEPLVGKKSLLALSDGFMQRCEAGGVAYDADIITNGYLLDADTCIELATRKVTLAQVGLDGPPDVHDRMRPLVSGKGSFADPVAALRPSPRFADWSPYLLPAFVRLPIRSAGGPPGPHAVPGCSVAAPDAAAVAAEHREYGDPAGRIRLRRAIVGWVARSRSVTAAEDTVVITGGAQHAIDLVARILLEPGDGVAVEDPGYVPVVRLFGALGARVVGVPVDDQGLVVDLLPPSARIVYVTPSHQFPLGMTMSMPRRRALLRWAEHHDAAVIEDDYDTEFRYVYRPLEPLQTLDANGRVVYVGSFSKTFSPSVRLGFTVVPQPLAEPVAALRQLIDWHPPTAMQTALASFIDDGLLDKHIRRNRRIYAERHHILIQALSGPLADHLTARAANAGLHVAAVLREGLRENAVLPAAARHGIVTSGLRDCFQTPRHNRAADRIRRSQHHRPVGSTTHTGPHLAAS